MSIPMDDSPINEKEIFEVAAALRADERANYLNAACGDNLALRARIERLLMSYEASKVRHGDTTASFDAVAELARLKPEEGGEMIGPYKLREQIGEGGFGTVWVADQERPVRRRVAGGAEDHQDGNGYQGGHRTLRAGAAGAGDDGASEHRQGVRRRRDSVWAALLRHGVGARGEDHRLLR